MPIDQLEQNFHECDLFLFTSYSPYQVNRSLIQFASEGQRNFDGWGIGYFSEQEGCVVRSSDPAADNLGQVSNEFRLAADIIKSRVVLGHLRRTSRGTTRVENNHPFKLHFLNNDWLFIHNGTATVRDLVPNNRRVLLESDSDSPRVFEFMKDQILEYMSENVKKSLIEAVRFAFSSLLERDPNGGFNIILSNGHISFVFIHHRPFYLIHREKESGDTALISTLRYNNELCETFNRLPSKKAKMLVFNGDTLIFNGDIPK